MIFQKQRPILSLIFLFCIVGLSFTQAGCTIFQIPGNTIQPVLVTTINPSHQPTLIPDPVPWPTREWLSSTPEEQQMDSELLNKMVDTVEKQKIPLHSLLIIRHGVIVSENYFLSFSKDTLHDQFSVTKSFISTLIGITINKGQIDNIQHKVMDYFPDRQFKNMEASKKDMTLEDLLTMRTGLDWTDSNHYFTGMMSGTDWSAYVLGLPMKDKPGKKFNYCTGCTHVLSTILKQVTGMETEEFAKKELLSILGINDYLWQKDYSGTVYGGSGMKLKPRDMAKLGYLYLHQGYWDGKQIISSEWVKNATQVQVKTGTRVGIDYGYLFWIYPKYGAYAALGYDGQTVFVIPDLDLIIVVTASIANHEHDDIFNLIDNYVVPSVKK